MEPTEALCEVFLVMTILAAIAGYIAGRLDNRCKKKNKENGNFESK